ncbi:MAG TPA: CoA pyrophosphatase [Chloroflexaceae bacterium]|nr:CoA pyrophosphatase [Chloroflexaceae bacterium]
MQESLLERQSAALRRAVADPTPPSLEEMLVLRDLAGQLIRPMEPPPGLTPREAAALVLLYPGQGELWLPLTVRSARLTTHQGEVSLPGGGADPGDGGPAGTALREAWEELGIRPANVEVLGSLTPFYIPPSNNRLTPVVGLSVGEPELRPDPNEVEAAFSVPLRALMDPATVREEVWERRGVAMRVPFYALEGYKVWGATALLLSELVARLRRAGL